MSRKQPKWSTVERLLIRCVAQQQSVQIDTEHLKGLVWRLHYEWQQQRHRFRFLLAPLDRDTRQLRQQLHVLLRSWLRRRGVRKGDVHVSIETSDYYPRHATTVKHGREEDETDESASKRLRPTEEKKRVEPRFRVLVLPTQAFDLTQDQIDVEAIQTLAVQQIDTVFTPRFLEQCIEQKLVPRDPTTAIRCSVQWAAFRQTVLLQWALWQDMMRIDRSTTSTTLEQWKEERKGFDRPFLSNYLLDDPDVQRAALRDGWVLRELQTMLEACPRDRSLKQVMGLRDRVTQWSFHAMFQLDGYKMSSTINAALVLLDPHSHYMGHVYAFGSKHSGDARIRKRVEELQLNAIRTSLENFVLAGCKSEGAVGQVAVKLMSGAQRYALENEYKVLRVQEPLDAMKHILPKVGFTSLGIDYVAPVADIHIPDDQVVDLDPLHCRPPPYEESD